MVLLALQTILKSLLDGWVAHELRSGFPFKHSCEHEKAFVIACHPLIAGLSAYALLKLVAQHLQEPIRVVVQLPQVGDLGLEAVSSGAIQYGVDEDLLQS